VSVLQRLRVHESVTATISHFKSSATQPVANNKGTGLAKMIARGAMQRCLIDQPGALAMSIWIEGDSARARAGRDLLHRLSRVLPHALFTLNCGAITEPCSKAVVRIEGWFTGAIARRPAKFELAHHGNIVLDEIADLSRMPVALLGVHTESTASGGEVTIPGRYEK